jgi:FG-GAP repeat
MRCSLALLVTTVLLVTVGTGVLASPTSAAEPSEAPQAEFTGAVGYGFAVAMSADGRTAVVGQLGTAHGSVQQHDWTEVGGLVHVFTFDGSSWSEQATLRASDQSYDLLFGNSVAISADGNTVIVGDPGECAYEHICEHTAYVFTRLGTTWTQQAEFHGGSGFGGSVALSGDGNTALVGAGLSGWYGLSYGPEGNAPPTIFGRAGTTWTQEATLSTGAAPTMFDNFGHALALSADGKTALVGDPDANDGAGAAYVFTGSGSSWTQQTELSATALPDSSDLGDAVALSADGSTALIGAPYGSSGGTAYLYRDGGSSWTQEAQLAPVEAEGRSSGGWFGITVALNRNGSIALVGAPLAEEDFGAVYAFAGEDSNWGQLGEFVLANATPYDYFGDAVALNGEGNVALIGRYDPGVDFFRVPAPSPRIPTGTKPPGTTSSNAPTPTSTSTNATTPSSSLTSNGTPASASPGVVADLAQLGGERIAPAAFRAAPHGASVIAATSRYGADVTYTLNMATTVRFTVVKVETGRAASSSGRCVRPTQANRGAHACTRLVPLPGSFTRAGNAGSDHFRFTGRLDGNKLAAGAYRLIATPTTGGQAGLTASTAFRIIR